jgi:transcriptional regulator with XRE-family HTH domain
MKQVDAAGALGVSQPYLSQLENGTRVGPSNLAQKAFALYKRPTVLPLPKSEQVGPVEPDYLEKQLAALGYPRFAHVRSDQWRNPAEVVLSAVVQSQLDSRLVEALPWVIAKFPDMNWRWLRDNTKLRNAQNRLGYVVHLAKEVADKVTPDELNKEVLSAWEQELESARLARETTLCWESMRAPQRRWMRDHRPAAAAHWNVLTTLTADQLHYAT